MELHFHGSLDDVRALMLYLESRRGGDEWTLPSGARILLQERPPPDPTARMTSWVVSLPLDIDGSNRRHAVIQAFGRDRQTTVIRMQDRRTVSPNPTTLGQIQNLGPDRAIGPPFEELCRELKREMSAWAPPPATGLQPTEEERGNRHLVSNAGLDPLDIQVIKVVRQIEDEGWKATDCRVAARLPLNPTTNEPYHRITINRRRNRLRDKGHKV